MTDEADQKLIERNVKGLTGHTQVPKTSAVDQIRKLRDRRRS